MLEYLKKIILGNILFSFDRIITPKLVHILYFLVLIAIALTAISHFFSALSLGLGAILWALVEILVFSLIAFVLLRIFCEMIIIYFHKNKQIVEQITKPKVTISLLDEVKEAIEELAQDEPLYKIGLEEENTKPEEAPSKSKNADQSRAHKSKPKRAS